MISQYTWPTHRHKRKETGEALCSVSGLWKTGESEKQGRRAPRSEQVCLHYDNRTSDKGRPHTNPRGKPQTTWGWVISVGGPTPPGASGSTLHCCKSTQRSLRPPDPQTTPAVGAEVFRKTHWEGEGLGGDSPSGGQLTAWPLHGAGGCIRRPGETSRSILDTCAEESGWCRGEHRGGRVKTAIPQPPAPLTYETGLTLLVPATHQHRSRLSAEVLFSPHLRFPQHPCVPQNASQDPIWHQGAPLGCDTLSGSPHSWCLSGTFEAWCLGIL